MKMIICTTCEGKGEVTNYDRADNAIGEKICPSCLGFGRKYKAEFSFEAPISPKAKTMFDAFWSQVVESRLQFDGEVRKFCEEQNNMEEEKAVCEDPPEPELINMDRVYVVEKSLNNENFIPVASMKPFPIKEAAVQVANRLQEVFPTHKYRVTPMLVKNMGPGTSYDRKAA